MAENRNLQQRFVLQVHVTSACDMRCAHCYQRDAEPRHMALKDFHRLMGQFSELLERMEREQGALVGGLVTITGGEPLLHPRFRQMVFSVWAHGFDLAVLTNGHLVDDSTAVLLRNAAFVQVSLDGDRDVHDAVRCPGDYDRVMSAIRTLKRARTNVIVSFTAHADNYRTLPAAAREARKAGANRFWSDRYLPLDDGASLQPLDCAQTVEYLDLLGESAQKRNGIVMRHRALQFLCGGQPYRCHAGREILAVTEECQVLPCRRLPIPCGDFRETPLVELYESNEDLVALRETACPEQCESCEHAADCAGGLRCLSAATVGDWNSPDPGCPIAHGGDAGAAELSRHARAGGTKLKRVKQAPPHFRNLARAARALKEAVRGRR